MTPTHYTNPKDVYQRLYDQDPDLAIASIAGDFLKYATRAGLKQGQFASDIDKALYCAIRLQECLGDNTFAQWHTRKVALTDKANRLLNAFDKHNQERYHYAKLPKGIEFPENHEHLPIGAKIKKGDKLYIGDNVWQASLDIGKEIPRNKIYCRPL